MEQSNPVGRQFKNDYPLKRADTRSGMKAGQLQYELDAMISVFVEQNPTTYLEVGCRYGDTFYDVMTSLPKGSFGCAVDLPNSYWGGDTEDYLKETCEELKAMGYRIELILGNSLDQETIDKVKSLGPFDIALLDGDHRYEGIRGDFEAYSPLCNVVAFHDIVGHGQRHSEGIYVEVPRFWDEIKHTNCVEIIEEGSKMGIGIWTKQDQ